MKISELEKVIRTHQRAYDLGEPTITDEAFDILVERLRARAPDSPVLAEVGSGPKTGNVVVHEPRMLSLGKVYDLPALAKWWKSTNVAKLQRESEGATLLHVQPKYDGVAVSLVYENGRLTDAATRGDGEKGDSIIALARRLGELPSGIPLKIKSNQRVLVRGEIAIPRSVFMASWTDTYATPRNMAAGIVSSDPMRYNGVLKHVRFIAYDTIFLDEPDTTYTRKYEKLSAWGFTIPESREVTTFDELHAAVTMDWSSLVDYELDGVVAKIEDPSLRQKLGATDHHPRWATAWKYQGQTGQTTLIGVAWNVSRTGAVTPVAVMEPIELSGVVVTRATLHNAATFVDLGPRVRSVLQVTRRGGVIPHVESVAHPVDKQPAFELPRNCPACGAALGWKGVNLVCSNASAQAPVGITICSGILREQIHYWCKMTGMLGIGPEAVDKLVDSCGVKEIADLYTLKVRTLRDAGFGPKQTALILEEIEKTLVLDAPTFLTALGIASIGRVAARELADAFDWETFKFKTGALEVSRRTQSARSALMLHHGRIEKILAHVRIEDPEGSSMSSAPAGSPFAGQIVVFTGALSSMERPAAWDLVRRFGGQYADSLTRKTTMLVVGDDASPQQLGKRTKAADYNSRGLAKIALLTESDFLALVKQADALTSS